MAMIILIIAVISASKSSHINTETPIFNTEMEIKNTFLLLTAIKRNTIAEKMNKTLVPPKNKTYELTVETTSFMYGELCKMTREIFTQIKLVRNIAKQINKSRISLLSSSSTASLLFPSKLLLIFLFSR